MLVGGGCGGGRGVVVGVLGGAAAAGGCTKLAGHVTATLLYRALPENKRVPNAAAAPLAEAEARLLPLPPLPGMRSTTHSHRECYYILQPSNIFFIFQNINTHVLYLNQFKYLMTSGGK